MKRFNTAKGIGGGLHASEDFRVREVIEKKFLRRFSRGKRGVQEIRGPYTLLLLTKTGMTTEKAIKKVAGIYGIHLQRIGYAGLKDKNAVTEQYITIKNFSGSNWCDENLSVEKVGTSLRPLAVGDLVGNDFEITLRGCRNTGNLGRILKFLSEKGMPNYFGPQRFGAHGDNHKIGKMIVKRNFAKALELINSQKAGNKYRNLKQAEKKKLKFFIHAYQSFLFNSVLETHIREGGKAGKEVPLVGFRTRMPRNAFGKITKRVMAGERVSQEDFRISELRISLNGSSRKAFVVPKIHSCEAGDGSVRINFFLPKGSYATAFLNELVG